MARGRLTAPPCDEVSYANFMLQTKKKKKKSKKSAEGEAPTTATKETTSATTTATPAPDSSGAVKRDLAPKVEEAEE